MLSLKTNSYEGGVGSTKTYKTVMQIHEAKLTLELQTDWALYHDVCDLRIHSNSKIWLKTDAEILSSRLPDEEKLLWKKK